MSAPQSPDQGLTFELEAVSRELQVEEAYLRDGQAARTLVRTADLRLVVVALQAGKSISPHQAKVTATVQTLSGHIRLQLPEQVVVDVPAGHVLVMGAGLSHDVLAQVDSVFTLTLGWPPSE